MDNIESARPAVVWFRRDLRLDDNPALTVGEASGRQVVPLVVIDDRLNGSRLAARRRDRFASAVVALDRDLRALGGRLIVRRGDPATVVPQVVREVGAREVLVTRDLTPYARRRDGAVAAALSGLADFRPMPGTLIVEPEATGEVGVFAAFYRRWQAAERRRLATAPPRLNVPEHIASEALPSADADGGPEALRRLAIFQQNGAQRYARDRNRLDLDATSHLSADLHLGTLSPLAAGATDSDAFVRQLAWRDWAHHLLWFAAGAGKGESQLGEPAWRDDPAAFDAWRSGQTGYPTVDAAMRQLAEIGWIHNRARLIVASFLTKDLLLDWRLGEEHFLATLVDGDVANNRLGWRWTAGVGHDPMPFVRVLNPVLQGERFDPHGNWARRWLPELREVPDEFVHQPWKAPRPPRHYPSPIVDHAQARARALSAFADRSRPLP